MHRARCHWYCARGGGGAGFPGTVDPALPTPLATLAVGQTTYPPQFDFSNLVLAQEGDTLWIKRTDDDAGTVNPQYYSHVLTLADITAADPNPISFPGLSAIASGTYRYRFYIARAGAHSPEGDFITHGPDDVAPVLSAGQAPSNIISSGAKVYVVTDTPEGTLYLSLCPTNVRPSNAQIKAGQTSTGAAATYANSVAINAIGEWFFSTSGGAPTTTYYPFWLHRDAAGNEGLFDGASFTTDVAVAFSLTEVAAPNTQNIGFGSATATFAALSFGAAAASRKLIAFLDAYNGGNDPSSVTIGGISATKLDTVTDKLSVWIADVPTGTSGDVVVTMPGSISFVGMKLWRMVGGNGTPTQVAKLAKGFNNSPFQVAVTTPSGGGTAILAMVETLSGTASWSNATAASQVSNSNDSVCSASRSTAGAVTVGLSGFGNQNSAMIAVSFAP